VKLLLWQTKIPATESKRDYLELMEKMRERQTMQLDGRELDIWIKEMHAHMRGIERKEELREHEEALKKREEELD
jgi:hypothetical protein